MPGVSVVFAPAAAQELYQAISWYLERSSEVAKQFEAEIARALRSISENPRAWPTFRGARRRMLMRRFPYGIIYEISDLGIVVLAVAHNRRRPFYWRRRNKQ